MAKLVSKTYGDALFEVAVEENRLDDIYEEVNTVIAALQDNPDLNKLMNHPKIDKEEKIKVVENVFSSFASKEVVGLIRMLVEKGRYNDLDKVLEYFVERVKEFKHIGVCYVTSAMELSDTQKANVEKKLLDTTKYVHFEMHYTVDSSIIGGMVIRIGDRVVDSSVKTKLYDLTRELSKIQLKVGDNTP
ncbi:F-type H+-transporting ATPase subunit delta [Lachnospiraceae bacterium C7]|nr:F-type H+-transporting ATPase subunit delta [Lachnospiraceae bacterium C7]